MNSDDIKLFEFTLNIVIIMFITWMIETNFSLERIHIAPLVAIVYFCLLQFIKNNKKD